MFHVRVAYSARNFVKSPLSDAQNFEMQDCQFKRIKYMFADKRNIVVEQDFGTSLFTSSSSHYFNETGLQQYLCKN